MELKNLLKTKLNKLPTLSNLISAIVPINLGVFSDALKFSFIVGYDSSLKLPLKLSMVVPCDDYNEVLLKPNGFIGSSFNEHMAYESYELEYEAASEKVMFEGLYAVNQEELKKWNNNCQSNFDNIITGDATMFHKDGVMYDFETESALYLSDMIGMDVKPKIWDLLCI